jgi:ribosomal protein L12E/L44/L45/RPP1/RPP2
VSVGIEADEIRLAQLLNGLRGKDIHEVNSLPESSSK